MRALEAEHARLSRFPEADVFADGTIIAWSKRFNSTDVVYFYVAVRAADHWYISGTGRGDNRARTYDELLDFIGNGTNVRVIDPDVGLELDELVIDEGDDGRPWRNRVKEVRNAVADQLSAATATEAVTANPPAGMIMAAHPGAVTYKNVPITEEVERFAQEADNAVADQRESVADNSGGWCMPTDTSLTSPELER